MPLVRVLLLAATATAVAAGAVSAARPSAQAAPVVVNGTVGPGYSIRLTRGGKRVQSLKAGRYIFRVSDRAPIHSFVLEKSHGGSFEHQITSVPFVGKKSFAVRLTRGEWEFYCAPHESTMHGDFTVT
jgi:hypothetical protein